MAVATNPNVNGSPETGSNSITTSGGSDSSAAPSTGSGPYTASGSLQPYGSAANPSGTSAAPAAATANNPNAWGAANVATVAAPPTPSEYMSTLEAAYAPAFQQSQQALNANQAALGTLTSGAGNYGDQLLQSEDAATLAQGELPLIQQGFGQQFQASQDNAAATNASLEQIQGESATQALQNQQLGNTDALFNAGQYNNVLGNNTSAANNYLASQAGYANGNYGTALQDYYGLLEGQQSGQAGIFGNGVGTEVNAYENGQNQGTQNTNNSDQGLGQFGGELFEDALATGAV